MEKGPPLHVGVVAIEKGMFESPMIKITNSTNLYIYIYIEQILETYIPQNSSCTVTDHPSRKSSKLDEQDMQETAGELRMNSSAMRSSGTFHTDVEGLGDLLEQQLFTHTGCGLKDLPGRDG